MTHGAMTRELHVLATGALTTVQDRGRPGRSAWGVGRSGAADRGCADLANRLVANPADAAMFEVTLGGLSVRAGSALTIALTGAPGPADVDGVPVPFGAPVPLAAGAVLGVGTPSVGLRTYVAVRGGLDVRPVLGSRSRDVLGRIGPPPLQPGDVVPVAPEPATWPQVDVVASPSSSSIRPGGALGGETVLGWIAGPHLSALDGPAQQELVGQQWTVSSEIDRTAVRLTGPTLLRRDAGEWPPEGLVRGAIQLPSSGQPVLMLADHPVTGGYPAIGALDDRSCDRAAQLRPGDLVRLVQRGLRVIPGSTAAGRA
jgi:biotin-dependent carboxylase-like uncharacterized protein